MAVGGMRNYSDVKMIYSLYWYQTGFDARLLFWAANDTWVIKQMNFLMVINTWEYTALSREHHVQLKKDLWELITVCYIYNGKNRRRRKTPGRSYVCQPGIAIYFQTKDIMYSPLHTSSWYLYCFSIYTYRKPKTCMITCKLNTFKLAIEKK